MKAKNIIWTLRISCLKTLGRKHKKNLKWALRTFGVDAHCFSPSGVLFSLPTTKYLTSLSKKFLTKDPLLSQPNVEYLFKHYALKLHGNQHLFFRCSVLHCDHTDIEIHSIKKLNRKINQNGKTTVLTISNKKVTGLNAILSAINCKQIPLCTLHHLEFELGNFSSLDETFLEKHLKINCESLNFRELFNGK